MCACAYTRMCNSYVGIKIQALSCANKSGLVLVFTQGD